MIPVRGYAGRRVGVLGLGRSGLATVAALRAGGAEPLVWDDLPAARQAAGAQAVDFTAEGALRGVEALIVSPGIPHLYPAPHSAVRAAWAAGVAVDNDIGLFFRSFATGEWDRFERTPQVVCITGSNGKSTTTALLTHILKASGRPVQMGGNIGRGVLDLDPAADGMLVVLELSSYQTELARALQPDIAVFLNLSPDHLDRHGGRGGYFAAKARLFTQGGPARSVIGVDEDEGRFLANALREEAGTGDPTILISAATKLAGPGWYVFARKGFLAEWRHGKQIAHTDLRPIPTLPGAHNHQNACAAWAVARALGMGPKPIAGAMATYPGLPHRAELIAERDGVKFINDSKATNADAAEKALGSFENIRWIAGGRPKEGGIEALRPLFGRVAKTYLIGEAAEAFARTLDGEPHVIAHTLENAVKMATDDARPGEVVLLSPACASFDQFPSFEARGAAFRALVTGH